MFHPSLGRDGSPSTTDKTPSEGVETSRPSVEERKRRVTGGDVGRVCWLTLKDRSVLYTRVLERDNDVNPCR